MLGQRGHSCEKLRFELLRRATQPSGSDVVAQAFRGAVPSMPLDGILACRIRVNTSNDANPALHETVCQTPDATEEIDSNQIVHEP